MPGPAHDWSCSPDADSFLAELEDARSDADAMEEQDLERRIADLRERAEEVRAEIRRAQLRGEY